MFMIAWYGGKGYHVLKVEKAIAHSKRFSIESSPEYSNYCNMYSNWVNFMK